MGVNRRLLCAAGVVLQWPWTPSSLCDAGGWGASCPPISLAPPPAYRWEKVGGVGVGSSETGGKNIQETSRACESGEEDRRLQCESVRVQTERLIHAFQGFSSKA